MNNVIRVIILSNSRSHLNVVHRRHQSVTLQISMRTTFLQVIQPIMHVRRRQRIGRSNLVSRNQVITSSMVNSRRRIMLTQVILRCIQVISARIIRQVTFRSRIMLIMVSNVNRNYYHLDLVNKHLFTRHKTMSSIRLTPRFQRLTSSTFTLLHPMQTISRRVNTKR